MVDLDAELAALKQKQADLHAALGQRRTEFAELQRQKRRVLEHQIRRAQARLTTADRKRRTRRLILLGSYIDSVSQTDPASMTRLRTGLNAFLVRDQDRELFDLPPTEPAE